MSKHGEQDVDRADAVRRARGRHAHRAAADRVHRLCRLAARRQVDGSSDARGVIERGLADAERLERLADAPVQPQHAQPALGLVLARVRERHRGAGQPEDDGGVLGEPIFICSSMGAHRPSAASGHQLGA